MHALVVDDSRAIRRILSGILTDIGFAVAEAGNGREALAQLQAHAARPRGRTWCWSTGTCRR